MQGEKYPDLFHGLNNARNVCFETQFSSWEK